MENMGGFLQVSLSHTVPLGVWGGAFYSLEDGSMALTRVDAPCACLVPPPTGHLGASNVPLTLLGLYCQIHDRPGLSRLPCGWPCSRRW